MGMKETSGVLEMTMSKYSSCTLKINPPCALYCRCKRKSLTSLRKSFAFDWLPPATNIIFRTKHGALHIRH